MLKMLIISRLTQDAIPAFNRKNRPKMRLKILGENGFLRKN